MLRLHIQKQLKKLLTLPKPEQRAWLDRNAQVLTPLERAAFIETLKGYNHAD